jgi:hypothetical protein
MIEVASSKVSGWAERDPLPGAVLPGHLIIVDVTGTPAAG